MELPVGALLCPICGGDLERIYSANIATAAVVKKVDELLNNPATAKKIEVKTGAGTMGPLTDIPTPETARIGFQQAIQVGREQRGLIDFRNSNMPAPLNQTPQATEGRLQLPRVRPASGSWVDADTAATMPNRVRRGKH